MKRFLALLFCSLSALAANYAPPPVVPDYSSLTNRAGSLLNPAVIVLGRTNALDGNGGIFLYTVSTSAVDNLTVLPSTSTSRWLRTSWLLSTTPAASPLSLSNGVLSLAALTNWFTFAAGTNMQVTVTGTNVSYAMTNNIFGAALPSFTATAPVLVSTNSTNVNISIQGLTNWFTFSAGTNMQVTLTSNSVSYAMTNTTFSGTGGSSLLVNGSTLTNANFIDGGLVKFVVSGTNVYAYITNYVAWEGIELQGMNLKDGVYVAWSNTGTNLTPYIPAESLDPTRWEHLNYPILMGRATASIGDIEYISVGANLLLDPATKTLSAVIPAGTNSWQIAVDTALVNTPNLADTDRIDVTASGTNVTFDIKSSSIGTNYFTATPLNLLLNQYRVNNLTNWFLSLTNNNSSDAGRIVWYTNSLGDYVAYATNLPSGGGGSGAGTNLFVNGVLIQPAYLTNSAEVFISTNGNGHIVFDVNDWDGFWSDLTNSLVASNNIAFAYDTANNKLMISAITSGGTGTAVTVDGGSDLTRANFADASTTGLFDISGTNITHRLPDRDFGAITVHSSGAAMNLDASAVVTTNIADSAVTTAKIADANVTIGKLGTTGTPLSTNFLAGDYSWKQITTNMIPGLVADILSAATNGPAGGGTAVFVNGTSISNPNFTNSSTVLFSVSNSTNISATVTNVAGSTTSNVVQRTGFARFRTTATSIADTNYSGVITDLTHNSGDGSTRMLLQVTLTGVTSTNYQVGVEIFDTNVTPTPAVWDVTEKTSSGFKINSSVFDGSAQPNGYWYRIWVLDTVTVGGSGGDVISTANNNFTGTNTFSQTVNTSALTVNDDAYAAGWNGSTNVPTKNAVYDKIESMTGSLGVSVKDPPYNATGDGVTDDTAAIQNAMTNSVVFFPRGTYLVQQLFPTNGIVYGSGSSSVIKRHSSFTSGALIETRSNLVSFRDLFLDGNNPTNQKAVSTRGSMYGLKMYAAGPVYAERLQLANWSGAGLYLIGVDNTTTRPNLARVTSLFATNCQTGVWFADTNASEYCTIGLSKIKDCYVGLEVGSANVTVFGNDFTDSTYGWRQYPLNGRGHSLFVGNTVNHSNIRIQGTTTGPNIVGNSFMGSTGIDLYAGARATFRGNVFENCTVYDYAITNIFDGNTVVTALNQGTANRSIYRNNRLNTGALLTEVQSATYAASITNDARFGQSFKTTLTGNLTLWPPINAADGQQFQWEFLQDSTGTRTVTLTNFVLPTEIPTLNIDTNANKRSILEGVWNSTSSRVYVTRSVSGL